MRMTRLIGITGLAGVGKDTLADHLVSTYGYHKYSLASPIKKLLNERFGWADDNWKDREWKEQPELYCGWDDYKTGVTFSPRSWAQWLGTEAGRMVHGDNCWVDMMEREWLARHEGGIDSSCNCSDCKPCMVVPDVRFDNEAFRIRNLGGLIIRVTRGAAVPVSAHPTEAGISPRNVDAHITNDGSVKEFIERAVKDLKYLAGEGRSA
jgi:hypothetical protein